MKVWNNLLLQMKEIINSIDALTGNRKCSFLAGDFKLHLMNCFIMVSIKTIIGSSDPS